MFLLPAVASGTPTLNTIHHTDALTLLRALPSGYVDCVVTSPPYYALRDYGVDGQIGLEATPQQYIARMMEVFTEMRRVLKPSGTVWVNLGDSYASDSKGSGGASDRQDRNAGSRYAVRKIVPVLPPKSLMMIPARFAIAMQDDGWILRSEIVWAKRAPMPESVTDRPTKSHEMIYLFAKQGSYWYDQEAVRERASGNSHGGGLVGDHRKDVGLGRFQRGLMIAKVTPDRNMRDVWHLSPEPTRAEHFAAFPTEIPRRCILAGCPEQVCAVCGKPYEPELKRSNLTRTIPNGYRPDELKMHGVNRRAGESIIERTGLHPTCKCNAETRPGIVLDFFMGTGTTAYMARKLGRSYIGCDLNADYVAMARRRLSQSDPYQSREVAPGLIQKSMFAGLSV